MNKFKFKIKDILKHKHPLEDKIYLYKVTNIDNKEKKYHLELLTKSNKKIIKGWVKQEELEFDINVSISLKSRLKKL